MSFFIKSNAVFKKNASNALLVVFLAVFVLINFWEKVNEFPIKYIIGSLLARKLEEVVRSEKRKNGTGLFVSIFRLGQNLILTGTLQNN